METVQETSNYGRFELLEFNRKVENIKRLEESMRIHGWISAYPMHVVKNGNGKLKIKAGHHRFEVARKLGIPVKFVVCDDEADIYELERSTTPWSVEDYLTSHISSGFHDYLVVKNYHEYTGIHLAQCISLLAGESASSMNWLKRFKQSSYRLGDPTHATIVGDIIVYCRKLSIPFATNSIFVQAVSKVVWVDEFDPNVLKNKIRSHRQIMVKQASKKDYVNLLDTVYNYKSTKKIPLAFLADEKARENSPLYKNV